MRWGVFWVDRTSRPRISRKGDFRNQVEIARDVEFAIQSGPTILFDGEVQTRRDDDRARRTALGIDAQGRLVIMVALLPVSLNQLARFAKEELEMVALINLDGGSSTQLVVRDGESASVPGFPVAVGIGLYPRTAPGRAMPSSSRSPK